MSINPNAIVPTHRPEMPYERKRKPDLVTWLSIGALVLFLGVCGFGLILWTNGDKIGCMLSQCDKNPVGMPAPWPEIVAAADEAAHRASPDAVLKGVSAQPVAHWSKDWSVEKTLEVTFDYENAKGETLYVDVHDTNPGATADAWGPAIDRNPLSEARSSADPARSEHYERLKANEAHRREALSKIKVVPRQAEVLTWEEALADARNDNTEVAPWIYLDFGFGPEGSNIPPKWEVTYKPVPAERPPGLVDINYILAKSSEFVVDATTGEILETNLQNASLHP